MSQGSSVGHDSGVASDIDSKKFSDSSSSSSRSSSTSYEGDETDSLSGSTTSSDNETSSSVVTSETSVNKSRRESLSRLEEIKAIRGTLKKTQKSEFQCYEDQEDDGGGTSGGGEDFLVCRTPPIISQDVTTFFLDENSDCLSESSRTKGQFPPLTFMSVASTDTDVSSMPSGSFAGIKLALGFDFDRSSDPSCQLTELLSTGGGTFMPGMELGSSSQAVTRGNTIRSDRGTVRGVRNRVRAGIATFQLKDSIQKTYAENERGRVVVYVTSLGVVREMLANCIKVRQIMRNLLVKIVEKDIFMSRGHQSELRERMETLRTIGGAVVGRSPTSNMNTKTNHNSNCPSQEESVLLSVPQVFVEGQYLGNADAIERLNEAGELRKMLRPFKCPSVTSVCRSCGGFGLLPCTVCNGSKKSVLYRNDFTQKFVALRCTACDESALVQCQACNALP